MNSITRVSRSANSVSLSVSPFLWLRDCVTASLRIAQDLWDLMPVRLTLCDLRAPGWGSPGFRSGLCFSLPCFVLLICCFSPYQSIWWCIRHPFNCAGRVNLPLCLFVLACSCWFRFCFCVVCLVVAFVCFAFVWFFWLNWHCDDSIGLCIWSFSSTVFLVHPCPKMEHHYQLL